MRRVPYFPSRHHTLFAPPFIYSPPWQEKVYQSYELCCGDGTGVGDGITPLQSAFDMAGAERYVELEVRRAVHFTVVAAVARGEGVTFVGPASPLDLVQWLAVGLFFGDACYA